MDRWYARMGRNLLLLCSGLSQMGKTFKHFPDISGLQTLRFCILIASGGGDAVALGSARGAWSPDVPRTWNRVCVTIARGLTGHFDFPCCVWCRWHTGSWGPCSATCGVGIQTREVYCLHPGESPAPAEECGDEKPHALQACSQFDCPPSWHIEEWQQVIWQPGAPSPAIPLAARALTPPPSIFSVFQDLWWGNSQSKSHLSAAVNGWQLFESVRWIVPRTQGIFP